MRVFDNSLIIWVCFMLSFVEECKKGMKETERRMRIEKVSLFMDRGIFFPNTRGLECVSYHFRLFIWYMGVFDWLENFN